MVASLPPGSGFVDANGARLFYQVTGTGEPLVLLHGGLCDSRQWEGQIEPFARRRRVVRYDMRGFGRSDLPATAFSHPADLRVLLSTLGIERAVILGTSFGGAVALDFALTYPEMVGALILAASGAGGHQWSAAVRDQWDAEDAAVERGDVDAAVEVNLRLWVDGPARTPEQLNPAVRERLRGLIRETVIPRDGGTAAPLDPPALTRLGEIGAPTLVITGDLDVPDVELIAERLTSGITGARRAVVPDTAHLLMVEQPAIFNQIVLDFLDSLGKQ